jgi:hypothetical protein
MLIPGRPWTNPNSVGGSSGNPGAYYAYDHEGSLSDNSMQPLRTIYGWDGQDFARYATPWELSRSILAKAVYFAGNTPIYSKFDFAPVVQNTFFQNLALVVGHVGTVNGRALIAPKHQIAEGYHDRLIASGHLFVAEQSSTPVAPAGWQYVGYSDDRYTVYTTPDGQVLRILNKYNREALIDANWVIDFVVAPMVARVSVLFAKSGVQLCTSAVGSIRGRATRTLLRGPTRELAEGEAAAGNAARSRVAQSYYQTNLRNPVAFDKTLRQAVGDANATQVSGAGFSMRPINRYDAALRARQEGFVKEFAAEISAGQAARGGASVPMNEFNAIYDRVAARWGDPLGFNH